MAGVAAVGFSVAFIFIGVDTPEESRRRVALRVTQGDHDVPDDKILDRFGRTLANLRRAIDSLPHVLVFDNSDLTHSYQLIAVFESSQPVHLAETLPAWLLQIWSPERVGEAGE